MTQIAIEEWAGSSPIYTRRMQRALGYAPEVEGQGDVVTIFKGLQLDIGAPPQFMDFRYTVHDPWHGEFHLDHCGALMDVEPLGPDYVKSMCHDIEDPTFDATAVATNAKAQVRPIHRPPRVVAGPAPALRVDGDHRRVLPGGGADPGAGPGRVVAGGRPRAGPDRPRGRGGVGLRRAAGLRPRLRRVLALGAGPDGRRGLRPDAPAEPRRSSSRCAPARPRPTSSPRSRPSSWSASPASPPSASTGRSGPDALETLALHPLLNPAAYVDASVSGDTVTVSSSPAHARRRLDHALRPALGPAAPGGRPRRRPAPRRRGDRHRDRLDRPTGHAATSPRAEFDEVAVTRISTGSSFTFEPRLSLPITPV